MKKHKDINRQSDYYTNENIDINTATDAELNGGIESDNYSEEYIMIGDNTMSKAKPKNKKNVPLKIIIPVIAVVLVLSIVVAIFALKDHKNGINSSSDNGTSSVKPGSSAIASSGLTSSKIDLSGVNIENKNYAFVKGIKVGGLDLSGKTYDEAYSYVEGNYLEYVEKREYTIMCDNRPYKITQKDFSYDVDVAAAVNEAYKLSNYIREQALGSDSDTKSTAGSKSSSAVASKTSSLTASEQEELEDSLSTDTDFEIKYTLVMESVSTAVSNVADEIDEKVVQVQLVSFNPDAAEGKQFKFKDGKPGKVIDQEKLTNEITNMINAGKTTGTVTCERKEVAPAMSASDINGKMSLISTFKTVSTNGYNGNYNMSLALQAVDGTILNSGDTLSFNECTGNSNLTSLGYLPANVIMNGQLATGIGGGICQSATTIYNASIRAGLTVVERYAHAWPSSYVPVGLDATIDYPGLDLKLKNSTSTPIYINCYMSGATLTCNIFGVKSTWWDKITCKSWVTSVEPGVSYNTSASRTYWLKGKEVKTESLKSSSYSLSQGYVRSDYDESTESTPTPSKPTSSVTPSKPPVSSAPASSVAPPTPSVTPSVPSVSSETTSSDWWSSTPSETTSSESVSSEDPWWNSTPSEDNTSSYSDTDTSGTDSGTSTDNGSDIIQSNPAEGN